MARRTGIIGGGALGLTLAYRLAGAGDQVTGIEREPGPGRGRVAAHVDGPARLRDTVAATLQEQVWGPLCQHRTAVVLVARPLAFFSVRLPARRLSAALQPPG